MLKKEIAFSFLQISKQNSKGTLRYYTVIYKKTLLNMGNDV